MNRSRFAALGTAAMLLPQAVRAADAIDVRVNFFPGAPAMPLAYGIGNGFFTRAGLSVGPDDVSRGSAGRCRNVDQT